MKRFIRENRSIIEGSLCWISWAIIGFVMFCMG